MISNEIRGVEAAGKTIQAWRRRVPC